MTVSYAPTVGIKLTNDNSQTNTSTNCTGPFAISNIVASTYGTAAVSQLWAWTPALFDGQITQDFEYLAIIGMPDYFFNNTGLYSVYVRKIEIVETILAIPPPTTGFEGFFYQNINNNKKYIGIKGKYRELIASDVLYGCFDVANISFININADPSSGLLGETLTPSQAVLYDGEASEYSSFFIVDEWTNKKYFVEAKRVVHPINIQTIEFHCTNITDPIKFNFYKFKMDSPSSIVWTYNSSNGYKVEFDGQLHSIGGGASAYYIQSPDLP